MANGWITVALSLAVVARATRATAQEGPPQDERVYATEQDSLGSLAPGKGFEVARNALGSLNIGLYTIARYIGQFPQEQSFVDHLGRPRAVNTRHDIQLHRVLLSFKGYVYDPDFEYGIIIWGLNSTEQISAVGNLSYRFGRALTLFAGIGSVPGTRSLTYNHPYWLAGDRVMADEYFRTGFSSGIWGMGEIVPTLSYHAMVANNISTLGVTADKDIGDFTESINVSWLPTTGEFGPRNGFGDFEEHGRVATRLGGAFTHSRETRGSQLSQSTPDSTQIRVSDSLFLFETGALADGVTVIESNFDLLSLDAGLKYRGFFLQGEYYFRWLGNFDADGPLPVDRIFDHGFYVQTSYMVLPRLLEMYASTSHVFGQFNDSHEVIGGVNLFPFDTHNMVLNGQVIGVRRSAASTFFGYYAGGQTGTTVSVAASVLF